MSQFTMPFQHLTLNSSPRTIDKKYFIWRITSISACILGTAVYLRPVEPYFGAQYFGILVPAFITGYIIINSCELFAMYVKYEYIFIEMCFAAIGAFGSGICGIYQLYKWLDWIASTCIDSDTDYAIQEFVLAVACMINSIALTIILIYRIQEKCKTSNVHEQ